MTTQLPFGFATADQWSGLPVKEFLRAFETARFDAGSRWVERALEFGRPVCPVMECERALIIHAARLLAESGRIHSGYVRIREGKIVEVVECDAPPADADHVLEGGLLAPGFLDLQVNGCFGVDFGSDPIERWPAAQRALLSRGVTGVLATFISAPVDVLAGKLEAVSTAGVLGAPDAGPGARILGVHLEGPFLSPRRHGAHNPDWVTTPSESAVSALLRSGAGIVKMVTLAPDIPGAASATARLAAEGIVVAIGHSDATATEARTAIDAGARAVTHLFNAMRPFHHRDPGIVSTALLEERVSVSLVLDGHNIAPPAAEIAFRCAGDRIFLVSDATAAAGQPAGSHLIGGQRVRVDPGAAPVTDDGTLAGSAITLDEAVRNAIWMGMPIPTAVAAATSRPAKIIGAHHFGRIGAGAIADLVWLDHSFRPQATWLAGELARNSDTS